MSLASALALAATMLLISATPGPSDVAVVARSLSAGIGQAAWMIVGIIAADLLFILCAVYGLAALTDVFDPLFLALKYLCATYLAWLAIGLWRSRHTATADIPDVPKTTKSSSSFMAGLGITLADPKAIVFYMGLLPAYVDLTSIGWADACLVAALAAGVIAVVKFSYALLAQRARLWMTRPGAARGLHVGASLLLLAAAVMLVLPGPTNT